jgi:hypothetical protein
MLILYYVASAKINFEDFFGLKRSFFFSYSLNKHLTDHLIGKIALLDKQTKSWFSDSMDLDQVSWVYFYVS